MDGLNDVEKMDDLLPAAGNGFLLITTRNQTFATARFRVPLEVGNFSDEETLEFLRDSNIKMEGTAAESTRLHMCCVRQLSFRPRATCSGIFL